MMNNMKKSRFDKESVIKILKERKAKFDQATEEFENSMTDVTPNSQCQ